MRKYIDYLLFTQGGCCYLLYTFPIVVFPILSYIFDIPIAWKRVVIIWILWIMPTILHIKGFKRYLEKGE